MGAALGALHAADLFFRFPALFDGLLALSGIYTASYGFGDYMDEVVYRNSPVDYLAGMSPGSIPSLRNTAVTAAFSAWAKAHGSCLTVPVALRKSTQRKTWGCG